MNTGGLFCTIFAMLCSLPAFATQWISIPSGQFMMGDRHGDTNETPSVETVDAFEIMRSEVTNRQFKAFTTASGYVTDVERNGEGHVWTTRWRRDGLANYQQPHGAGSSIAGLDSHPVVQVSARDANAYCMYHGARLPTEIEWEFAARGTDQRRYPWGNQPPEQNSSSARANFGTEACCAAADEDGFEKTAPVDSYPSGASPFDVQDMAGNVWEWTSSLFPDNAEHRVIRGGGWGNNAYCLRVSYRHGNPPHIGLNMVGFRCAR